MHRTLLLGLLAGNVLLRFFTNSLSVLPRVLNVWDLVVTLMLAGIALTAPRTKDLPFDTGRLWGRLLLFNIVCIMGSLLNPKHVHPLPALSQLLMWNEPILLFLAVVNLPFSLHDIGKFRRLLVTLLWLEIIIGIFQVPSALKPGQSERLIGTFAGNAEQFQLFILIGFFSFLATLQLHAFGKNKRLAAIFLILILVVLIDNKASWVALALTLLLFVPKLPELRGQLSGKFKSYAFVVFLILCGYQAVKLTSATYISKFGRLGEAIQSGNLMNLGKVKALRDVATAYVDNIQMPFVGSGLGTFYSRAAFQFFPFRTYEIYDSAPAAGGMANDSASMAGILEPIAGMKPFYKSFYDREKIYATGSGTADFPTSSYISLLGETGVVGTLLYLSFYVFAVRRARDVMRRTAHDLDFFPFAATAYASLIYLLFMGCYNYWLDCGRVNTIVWCLLALSVRYVLLKQREETADLEPSNLDVDFRESGGRPQFVKVAEHH